jgi:hypothetical protein
MLHTSLLFLQTVLHGGKQRSAPSLFQFAMSCGLLQCIALNVRFYPPYLKKVLEIVTFENFEAY